MKPVNFRNYLKDLFIPELFEKADPFEKALDQLCPPSSNPVSAARHRLTAVLESEGAWFSGKPIRHNEVLGRYAAMDAARTCLNILLDHTKPKRHNCSVEISDQYRILHGIADVNGKRLYYSLTNQIRP